jgi:hypothetical protein
MNIKTAFVVLSCDNYSDLWPMYTFFFEKNWADCPFDKYFVSNHKSVTDSSFKSILIGNDDSWSDGLLKALLILKTNYEHIFITLEDWPIIAKVDQNKFEQMTKAFFALDGNYLTFRYQTKPTHKFNNFFGIIDKGSLYRPTCVYALWKISVLEDLLVRDENAWEFERYGSIRSDKYDKFFIVYKSFFTICNTVVKGKWVRSEYNKITNLGFSPDLNNRKLFSRRAEFKLKTYEFIFTVLIRYVPIPWKIRRKLVYKIRGYKYEKA